MTAQDPPRASGQPVTAEQIALLRRLADADHWVVVATTRRNGSIQATVVTAGVTRHPLSGATVVGFVIRGGTVKLANWRRRPQATVTFRAGREWITVEGTVDMIGPDDPNAQFPAARLPMLLREVYQAAGGTHDDWDTYDRVMAEERRTAVFVQLDRVYTNQRR